MQRLRSKGSSLLGSLPHLKKRAHNSFAAVQDTYLSTKDTFERHRVVFTVGTSLASVATAWIGYTLRHVHDQRVAQRLESIEKAMVNNQTLERAELKKIVDPGSSRYAAYIATIGITFVIGYGCGWRGGKWYANRKFRKEQMKLLGQITPRRWELLGKVTTSDGYILSLQRIPVGYSGGSHGERTPVLLQHGVLMDGMTWLLLPPRQSLAFVLADHGYDVWIANSRGTKYSRGHTSLSTDEKGYWDWSWDELVKYDLPATVDYVHHQTGQNMHYIGHSQGQLMNRLRSATLLCPVAYLGQMSSFLAKIGADIFLGEV
ncbi:Triacylglycerol lipase 2 [Linum perenne]